MARQKGLDLVVVPCWWDGHPERFVATPTNVPLLSIIILSRLVIAQLNIILSFFCSFCLFVFVFFFLFC